MPRLDKVAEELWSKGYNVIPVGQDKKPLTRWSSEERISLEELKRSLSKASGIGIVAGPENYWGDVGYYLVIMDVDDPSVREKSPKLRWVLENTATWKTGPRCPKCYNKHLEVLEPGRRFKCPTCGHEFTLEEAARGLGAMVLAKEETVKRYLGGSTVRLGPVELLVNNYALTPPSLHPTGVRYEWVRPLDLSLPNHGLLTLEEEDLKQLLEELRGPAGEPKPKAEARVEVGKLRELQEHEVLELVDALQPAYVPGVRQHIWLFLSGWAAKAGVSPVSVARVLKALYDKTGDSDSLRTRASAIAYSYRKAGVSLEPYARTLEELLGVKPYGFEKEINEEEVKGRSGLQEILEQVLGEERAIDVIRAIEEKFGAASPFKGDSVVEILDYEKQLYAVANLRGLVVVRAVRKDGRLVYREKVFEGAPVRVLVYEAPGGRAGEAEGERPAETIPPRYQLVWKTKARERPIVVGPDTIDGVVERLKVEGLVYQPSLALGVLSAVLNGFVRRGRAEVKVELDRPGFYIVDVEDREKGVTVRKLAAVDYKIEMPKEDELREALLFLDELATSWFRIVIDRFSTAMKWWALAPFSYAIKQLGTNMPGLYHYGPPNTRKTTINIVGMSLWGYRYQEVASEEKEIPGAAVNTQPRLGYWISRGTFPICIREPGSIFEDKNMLDMIKSAIEGLTARGRYTGHGHRAYETFPALAALCFTSNTYIPRDASLPGKRLYILSYGYSEALKPDSRREDRELMERFDREVKPKLEKLKAIGKFIASRVAENHEILREAGWVGDKWLNVAESLLREAYRWVGLSEPEWLSLNYRSEGATNVYEDIRERIRVFLVEKINNEYNKAVGRVIILESKGGSTSEVSYWRYELPLKERIKLALKHELVSWLILRGEKVYITTGILAEMRKAVGEVVGDLRNLAELLGWEYKPKQSIRVGNNVSNLSVIEVPLEDFINFLAGWEENEEAKG
jgi:predicted RNA-binding Zn-ribbon protein involved in translation (DUF1610 family)